MQHDRDWNAPLYCRRDGMASPPLRNVTEEWKQGNAPMKKAGRIAPTGPRYVRNLSCLGSESLRFGLLFG